MTDLTAESRRQLKPLGKQAEIARRAQTVQAESRDARLRHPLTEPGMGYRFEV